MNIPRRFIPEYFSICTYSYLRCILACSHKLPYFIFYALRTKYHPIISHTCWTCFCGFNSLLIHMFFSCGIADRSEVCFFSRPSTIVLLNHSKNHHFGICILCHRICRLNTFLSVFRRGWMCTFLNIGLEVICLLQLSYWIWFIPLRLRGGLRGQGDLSNM